MENGCRSDRDEDVSNALLSHVERLLGFEYALVECDEPVEVFGQESEMVNALDEGHRPWILPRSIRACPRDWRGSCPGSAVVRAGQAVATAARESDRYDPRALHPLAGDSVLVAVKEHWCPAARPGSAPSPSASCTGLEGAPRGFRG